MKKSVINIFKTLICLAVVCVCFLALPKEAKAEDVYVKTETELKNAIENAQKGDRILLNNSIHITSTLIIDKEIELLGCRNTLYVDHTTGPTNEEKWGVYLKSGNITLKNLTIDGQNMERPRGLLYVSTGSGATVEKVTVQNNINTAEGDNGCGGIYVSRGTDTFGETVIKNCTVKNCVSKNGNGGGMTINSKNIYVFGCYFSANSASKGLGGGIYEPNRTPASSYTGCEIEGCVFEGNKSKDLSSGNDGYIGISSTIIKNCHFAKNTSIAQTAEKESYYLVTKGKTETNTFYNDFRKTQTGNLMFILPEYTGGIVLSSYDSGTCVKEIVCTATRESYDAYMELTKKTLNPSEDKYYTKTIDNLELTFFSTYYNYQDWKIFAYYYKNGGLMKIVMDCAFNDNHKTSREYNSDLHCVVPSLSLINVSDESTSATTQATRYGLSLLYQLTDGSFLVVDGGYESDISADRLYNKMVDLNGSKDGIIISAWIITHAHNDHAGGYVRFWDKYGSKTTIERVFYNFPEDEEFSGTYGDPEGNTTYKNKAMSRMYDDFIVYFPHAGETIDVCGAKIEFLYTTEMIKPVRIANINETSLVFTITVGNYKTLVLGDISAAGEEVLLNLYDDALKADIVTVAHHGYFGRTVSSKIYEAAGARVVLWPASSTVYNDTKNQNTAATTWLKAHTASSNIHVAADYKASSKWSYTMKLAEVACRTGVQGVVSSYLAIGYVVKIADPNNKVTSITIESQMEGDDKPVVLTDYETVDGYYVFPYINFDLKRLCDSITATVILKNAQGKVLYKTPTENGVFTLRGVFYTYISQVYPNDRTAQELIFNLERLSNEVKKAQNWNTEKMSQPFKKYLYDYEPIIGESRFNTGKSKGDEKIGGVGVNINYDFRLYYDIWAESLEDLRLSISAPEVEYEFEIDLQKELEEGTGFVYQIDTNKYRVYTEVMPPYCYWVEYTATLIKNNQEIHFLAYSVNSYCCRMWGDPQYGDLIHALYNFGLAAEFFTYYDHEAD